MLGAEENIAGIVEFSIPLRVRFVILCVYVLFLWTVMFIKTCDT